LVGQRPIFLIQFRQLASCRWPLVAFPLGHCAMQDDRG
jgi:hypothetical protein